MREKWLCLNGEWDFEIDSSESGEARKFYMRDALDGKINVPFCPESKLSGVENRDFMNAVWYMKKITWVAALGYVAGIAVYYVEKLIF